MNAPSATAGPGSWKRSMLECGHEGCTFHGADAGCRIVERVPANELTELFGETGAHLQPFCPLLEKCRRELARAMGRAASADDPFLTEIYLVATELAERKGDQPVNHSYLLSSVLNRARDETRKSYGLVRCGNCQSFLHGKGICQRPDASYAPGIPADTSPKDLEPPCESFRSRKLPADLGELPEASGEVARDAEIVWTALDRLAVENEHWHALIVAVDIEELSLRELSRQVGVDRRRLGREHEDARRRLARIVEDLI